ncbi:fructan beta-fructosidase [Parapedobacter luteus]|uniref:Fructan beta-fructosidase n=1 Tax=Parapedobacter luteus TaxID=623280 RepID=A0A1T5DW54_9SPHI|nr:glycoside hydrolase family 32 protein [Parapedobacter luteus]SKB75653.1 fructan beta-fructosidase [Parapedobacter luteus]
MKNIRAVTGIFIAMALGCTEGQQRNNAPETALEQHRLNYHFSPKTSWMNDPNGMVYHNGTYHLFFQHNPDSNVWGPMHWGHATSTDLVHWEEQSIGLYPDSLGTIFSGSAVVDKDNTAGFGENALVAIFTHHNHAIEDARTGLHQYQSIAYSTDEGTTWTKYEGNPVLPNPGIWDFRDPKVMWHEATGRWIMTLATKQTVTFYSSPNLKVWTQLSEFGDGVGAHGGVWECPDLISFDHDGKEVWVLLVSINPGGPNGGSATQYFVGDFDGTTFTPYETEAKWLDYGRDNYAGVTWSNIDDRRVFIGWMNNWDYANVVPTGNWRGAATIARDLDVTSINGKWYVTSKPVPELENITELIHELQEQTADETSIKRVAGEVPSTYRLDFMAKADKDFTVKLRNDANEWVDIGYDAVAKQFFIDRRQSGNTSFKDNFASRDVAPRIGTDGSIRMSVFVDVASLELFADDGLTVMTEVFFPTTVYNDIILQGGDGQAFGDIKISRIASIWK